MESIAYECGDMANDCQRFRDLLESRRAEVCKGNNDPKGHVNLALALAVDALRLSERLLTSAQNYAKHSELRS